MKKNEKGFTLIELMAVLVILGILGTIVVVNVAPVFQRANLEKIKADIAQTEKALEMYKFNELQYPSTSQGLEALNHSKHCIKESISISRGWLHIISCL